mmetsp:Transcript_35650/g.66585  ORF Transcript_35650/g.66585 Transcript_35650/m.66585 type:complete len:205 (+) Transcript_35650:71-685(+)
MKEESISSLEHLWGIILIFVIFSLLLLSPLRLFKEKFLPDKFQHLGHVDHEHFDHRLKELKKKESQVEELDDAWNADLGIDSDSDYHASKEFGMASSSDEDNDNENENYDDDDDEDELQSLSPRKLSFSGRSQVEDGDNDVSGAGVAASRGGSSKIYPMEVEVPCISHSSSKSDKSDDICLEGDSKQNRIMKYIDSMTSSANDV